MEAVVTSRDTNNEFTDKESLRQNLLRGDYRGLEVERLEWLRRSVPAEYKDREELEQQVSFYALEAIHIYDSSKGMKFSTFLVKHLQMRCGNYQQYLWTRSSGNKKCRMLPIVVEARDGRKFEKNSVSGMQRVSGSVGGDQVCVEQGRPHYKPLSVRSEAESICAVSDFIEALSDNAREYLNKLFNFEDQEMLVAAFQSKHFRSKVAAATGLSKKQVEKLADEVREKFPEHLGD